MFQEGDRSGGMSFSRKAGGQSLKHQQRPHQTGVKMTQEEQLWGLVDAAGSSRDIALECSYFLGETR